jgi:hypothetical protein
MYRAPEMCDLYSRQVVNEKAGNRPVAQLPLFPPSLAPKVDVWALGCMAYLLAFNRHAFPDGSALATLTGKYMIPPLHSRSQQVLLARYFPSSLVFHPVAGLAHPLHMRLHFS